MGVGNPSTNRIGNVNVFGEDLGTGPGQSIPTLLNVLTATFLPATASLNIQFQGAPDNGTNNPGTWTTYAESGPIIGTSLVVPAAPNNALRVFSIDWPFRLFN